MGADLFGSLAESTCAALVVSSTSWPLLTTADAIYFPLVVTAVGILASFISVQFVKMKMTVEAKLRTQLIVSSALMSIFVIPTLWVLPEQLDIQFAGNAFAATRGQCYGCIMLGLWSGLLIGLSTEYYTSHSYGPTRELARACLYDAATNIIKGLAPGYMSNVIPIIIAHHWKVRRTVLPSLLLVCLAACQSASLSMATVLSPTTPVVLLKCATSTNPSVSALTSLMPQVTPLLLLARVSPSVQPASSPWLSSVPTSPVSLRLSPAPTT